MNLEKLQQPVLEIAVKAGDKILEIYQQPFDVHEKTDGSPVTTADQSAHELIAAELERLTPEIPVLSEESAHIPFEQRRHWNRFWLVDPLDGTKEFIHKNGEFTVNIALMESGIPVLGVVHTPARGFSHFAARNHGAFRNEGQNTTAIHSKKLDPSSVTLVASRSHAGAAVTRFKESLEREIGEVNTMSMGSALKICLVAEGNADIYPRLGLTSEWDTAASHCILTEAGGSLTDIYGVNLRYNKESLLNPWFLAIGDSSYDWLRHISAQDVG